MGIYNTIHTIIFGMGFAYWATAATAASVVRNYEYKFKYNAVHAWICGNKMWSDVSGFVWRSDGIYAYIEMCKYIINISK